MQWIDWAISADIEIRHWWNSSPHIPRLFKSIVMKMTSMRHHVPLNGYLIFMVSIRSEVFQMLVRGNVGNLTVEAFVNFC